MRLDLLEGILALATISDVRDEVKTILDPEAYRRNAESTAKVLDTMAMLLPGKTRLEVVRAGLPLVIARVEQQGRNVGVGYAFLAGGMEWIEAGGPR